MNTYDSIDRWMQRLYDAGIYPVRGGAPAEVADEVRTVEGDPISRAELEEIRNRRKWKSEQQREAERLKSERAQLRRDTEIETAKERELAVLRAEVAELRRTTTRVAEEAGEEVPDYPDPVDDPGAFRTTATQRERALRSELAEMKASLAKLTGRLEDSTRSVAATVNGATTYAQVVSHNNRLVEDYVRDHQLSEAESEDLRAHLHMARVPGRGYGEYAEGALSSDGRQIWKYTPGALLVADRAARPDAWETRIREEERVKVEAARPTGQRTLRSVEFGRDGVPAKTADVSELAKFYYSLPPESQAAQKFIDGLPVPTVQQILEFRSNLEAADLGYEGPAPASPLGVQEHVVEVL